MFRSLLHNWVRKAAQDALSQQAGAALDADAPCDVAFIFALGMESGGLEDLLTPGPSLRGQGFRVVCGTLAGRQVAIVIAGIGPRAVRRATEAVIAGHRPKFVVSAGFSGALQPEAQVGDIVLAERIVHVQGHAREVAWKPDPHAARQPHLHVGTLLNVSRIVRFPRDKRALGQQHGALAVDLESLAVAEVAHEAQVPFLAVRIISDDIDDELPEFVDRYALQSSLAGKSGVVLGALLRKPSTIKSMYQLREDGLVLSDKLARFLASMVRVLIPDVPQTSPEQV